MKPYRLAIVTGVCFALCQIVGCGGSAGPKVTGKVTFSDGTPLTQGAVVFGSELYTAEGEIQSDGSYALQSGGKAGCPAGSYKVFLAGPIFGELDDGGDGDGEGGDDEGEEEEYAYDETEGDEDEDGGEEDDEYADDGGGYEEEDGDRSMEYVEEGGEALVHTKFSSPETSGLTCTVEGGMTFDITVEKPE